MKASDADRDEVVTALSEHLQAGRLTTEEPGCPRLVINGHLGNNS